VVDHRPIDIDAPVIFVVHFVTGAREKSADIAASSRDLPTFQTGWAQYFVEVGKLSLPGVRQGSMKRTAVGEETPRFAVRSCSSSRDNGFRLDGPRN
jgi:hypothetical protein